MQVKLLKSLVEEIVDENAVPIVEILYNKKHVNEFLIAKKMEMTINQIRNILYKLSAEGLVSFIRKKDKRKGWYIYYWTLDTLKSMIKIKITLERQIMELKIKLQNRQHKRFYVCKPCNMEVTEEKALEDDFMCEECAEVYTLSDNTKDIRDLKGKITRKEKELELISEEVSLILEKEDKKKQRIAKKEQKEKELEKEKKKAARKKSSKKVTKKKVVKKKVARKKRVPAKAGKKKASKKVKKGKKPVKKKSAKAVKKKGKKKKR